MKKIILISLLFISCEKRKVIVVQKAFTPSSNGVTSNGNMTYNFEQFGMITKDVNDSTNVRVWTITKSEYIYYKIGDTLLK